MGLNFFLWKLSSSGIFTNSVFLIAVKISTELIDEEREILYYLMAMRLVTSIIMSSHSAKLFPDNDYIIISQKPARALLKKLEEDKYILS